MIATSKVQYDVEGNVLKRNLFLSRMSQIVLYGLLLAVVVIGWVVYRQGEAIQPKMDTACENSTPLLEELRTDLPEIMKITEETPSEGTTTESTGASGLIDSLLSPFIGSESAIVELTMDTDGFSIKFGENEKSLTELAKDSELNALFGLALQELLSLGQEKTSGRRVIVDPVEEPEATTTTTTESPKGEEIWSWTSGHVMGFRFRYEDNHWELDVTSGESSSQGVDSEEGTDGSIENR